MPLDDDLLRAGRAALARVHDAHHQVEVATADLHHTIRRLNVAGASRREIATAFGLSHQRVDQIVVASGGRFRDWLAARRRPACVPVCSFCAAPSLEGAAPLVHGPGVAICSRCVERMAGVAAPVEPGTRCSFCARHAKAGVTRLHGGTSAVVCNQCLRLAHEIMHGVS